MFVSTKSENVKDEYIIKETLGEGAFGKVYKVVHKRSGFVRALKTIKKNSVIKGGQGQNDELFNEMSILKKLNHPNVINIYELF
jgi:calcium-dependent protein kinase